MLGNLGTLTILAAIASLVATVLAFIFIVPDKKRARLNSFGKFLHDTFNFKYLIVEKILQALYIFATVSVFFSGFFMLFYVQPGYDYGWGYSSPSRWYGGYGLLVMILGPIAVRLAYEFIMMAILLIKNVIQINNKLKGDDSAAKADIFASAPKIKVPQKPAIVTCPNCGMNVEDGVFCTNCGAKMK